MQSRNSFIPTIVLATAFAGFLTPVIAQSADQTVDQLMASDAREAVANADIAAAKAEKAAREAAGLPPPGVVAQAKAKAVHQKVFELVSILGLTGQRQVVVKVDGRQIELNEPSGESQGYRLIDIDGTCAMIGEVRKVNSKGHKSRTVNVAHSAHNVCYVQPIQFMSDRLSMGMDARLPSPFPMSSTLPPSPAMPPSPLGNAVKQYTTSEATHPVATKSPAAHPTDSE